METLTLSRPESLSTTIVTLDGKNLSLQNVIDISENFHPVALSDEAIKRIKAGREKLERQITHNETKHIPIYGTNRGCGDLKDMEITPESFYDYQVRYIKAHNCGTGAPLPIGIARAIMVIRLNSFAKGLSGMKLDTCQLMVQMLNKKVTPWILEEGSVGASGDLVPLAMMGATMITLPEAKAYYPILENGVETHQLMFAWEAFVKADLVPVKLGAKEAMGLTNGSNFIAANAIIALRDTERLLKAASISASLSLEAIRGEKKAYQKLINEMSHRHNGQILVANQIRKLISGSMRTTKAAQEYKAFVDDASQGKIKNEERVQDRYSFRCVPQIHGAAWEALQKLRSVLETEINSATDNPLFDFDNSIKAPNKEGNSEVDSINFASGGNFHGQMLATPIDYLKQALTAVGLVTDKRTFSLLGVNLSYGLPQDLAIQDGKGNSGYMIAQYAGAARAAENRVLSTPASVMSVSTAANQEDFVSMGSIGALHLRKVVYNCQIIVAIELLCATRALQLTYNNLSAELQILGTYTAIVYEKLKSILPAYEGDTYIRTEIESIVEIVKSGDLVEMTKSVWDMEF